MTRLIVHAIIKNINSEILILQRSNIKADGSPNSRPYKWDLPGGSVEEYETPREALVREIFEETGQSAIVGDIIYEYSNFDQVINKLFTTLVFTCTIQETKEVALAKEHVNYKWLTVKEILDNTSFEFVTYLKPSIEKYAELISKYK